MAWSPFSRSASAGQSKGRTSPTLGHQARVSMAKSLAGISKQPTILSGNARSDNKQHQTCLFSITGDNASNKQPTAPSPRCPVQECRTGVEEESVETAGVWLLIRKHDPRQHCFNRPSPLSHQPPWGLFVLSLSRDMASHTRPSLILSTSPPGPDYREDNLVHG